MQELMKTKSDAGFSARHPNRANSEVRRSMNAVAMTAAVAVACLASTQPAHAQLPTYSTTVLQPLQSTDWTAAYDINAYSFA